MRTLVLLFAALLLAPLASAKAGLLDVSVDAPDAPLAPGASPVSLRLHVDVACALLAQNASLTLRVERVPSWASVGPLPEPQRVPAQGCPADPWTWEPTLEVASTPAGAAFEAGAFAVRATLDNGTATWSASAQVPLVEGFSSRLLVEAPGLLNASPDTLVDVPVNVTNEGNGAARVFLVVLQTDERLQVAVPPPTVLAPGEHATLTLPVTTPAMHGSVDGRIALRVVGASVADPRAQASPADVELRVATHGTALVPAPALVPALLAAALIARRVRRGR